MGTLCARSRKWCSTIRVNWVTMWFKVETCIGNCFKVEALLYFLSFFFCGYWKSTKFRERPSCDTNPHQKLPKHKQQKHDPRALQLLRGHPPGPGHGVCLLLSPGKNTPMRQISVVLGLPTICEPGCRKWQIALIFFCLLSPQNPRSLFGNSSVRFVDFSNFSMSLKGHFSVI